MELSDDLYIIVPKWERFQHYRDRNPTWIKLYSKLLHDPKFLSLSLASRGLLMTIWLMYSQQLGELRVRDAMTLERHRGGFGLQLISLRDAGFIELSASRLLATKKEREEEEEKESPQTPLVEKSKADRVRELSNRALDIATDWEGGGSDVFAERLDDLERELKARLTSSQRERLWDEALRHEQEH